jgi:galactose mutarotase-like enzyme
MTSLENDFLRVTMSAEGAELHSLFDKKRQREYLWQADPAHWNRRAPNLFPVVGACIDNQLLVNGDAYPMPKHGFSRDMHFNRIETSAKHAKYALHYSKETYELYPFKFEFQVVYDLIETSLRVSYKVINHDKDTIWFSLGAHPAFNVPFSKGGKYESYFLEFEAGEPLVTHTLDTDGCFDGGIQPVATGEGNRLYLTRTLFNQDALVFKNPQSRSVTLRSAAEEGGITVSFPHFNYLGIWAKPGADFVCIEPWLGCADTAGKKQDIREKEGIQFAEHGHVFETELTITVN